MASLTIRNLTIHPLELKTVERLEGESVPEPGGLARINSTISGFLSKNSTPSGGVKPRDNHAPLSKEDIKDIVANPFETKPTNIRAADPTREILRLTFQAPGQSHKYQVDVPGPSPRSIVMKRLDGAPHELTAVYIPTGAYLSIFSSTNLAAWMKELHNDYPLSALSIPGTHNSPTCHTALPSVRCQAVGVKEQLDNGVRFFDIRVSANTDNDDLALVHAVFPISLTGNKYFHDMLKDIYGFLDRNPSETLLMSVKREGTGKGTDQHLSRYLHKRYCGGNDARRWFTEPRIPKLGEARGKIVLVRRFNSDDSLRGEHGGKGWGIDAASWPDNCADGECGSKLIRVQDFYEVDQSTNIEKKIELARAHLERAGQQLFNIAAVGAQQAAAAGSTLPFFVNFLSASNFFNASCWPEKIAGKVNPAVIEYLCMRHAEHGKGPGKLTVGDASTGIVVTDWVGHNGDWDLIRCIVGWNARLQLKK